MYTPLTQLEYDIECANGIHHALYYYTPADLREEEGYNSPCLQIPVELYDQLFAN